MPSRIKSRPANIPWAHWLAIALSVLALTVSLSTRSRVPSAEISHGRLVQSQAPQAMRQHLDNDAAVWVPFLPASTVALILTFYPRFSPAGPPVSNLLFEEAQYNRPPPSC
jgi:hypothetical protein